MLNSDDLAFFTVLAGARSLAAAARQLDVTAPAVSQRLQALEAKAGVRLLERSGRQTRLTDEGALVAEHGRGVAEALAAMADALGDRTRTVSGHLRVAAPHGFGRRHVAPVVAAFGRAHPRVTLSLELSDRPGVALLERCDVVVHIGSDAPPGQRVTTLAPNRRILCASPAYLELAPPIASPADLADHCCLVVRENDEDVTLWRFTRPRHPSAAIRIRPTLQSNDGSVVRAWAVAGMGIALRSEWDVADDLAAGRLVAVLPAWKPPAADVVVLLGARHGRSSRTTVFLDMLRRALNPAPWLTPGKTLPLHT